MCLAWAGWSTGCPLAVGSEPRPGSVFSFVVLRTPLLGRHMDSWWIRQSCRCKKVLPHNSHRNPGPTVFTDSSNLSTFLSFLAGFLLTLTAFLRLIRQYLHLALKRKYSSTSDLRIQICMGLVVEVGGSHLGLYMTCLSSGRPSLCLWSLSTGSVPCTSRAYVCALGVFPMRPLFSKRPHNSDTWLRAPGSGTRGHADGPGVGNPRPLCTPSTSTLSFH